MLNSITAGLKFEVTRSFMLLYFSMLIMLFYAVYELATAANPARLILYISVFIYYLYFLKVWKLYKDFKTVLNCSTSMTAFNTAYQAYTQREDYLKFNKRIFFLFGWACMDVVWILISLFK